MSEVCHNVCIALLSRVKLCYVYIYMKEDWCNAANGC